MEDGSFRRTYTAWFERCRRQRAACDILRHAGVDLAKKDFLATPRQPQAWRN
jgi:hypothetical protein